MSVQAIGGLRAHHARVTAADRLALTLVLAIIVHAVAILAVSFAPLDRSPPEPPVQTLDITLVKSRSPAPPETADYLAQADHQGSGTTEEKIAPAAPQVERLVTTEADAGNAPETELPAAPAPRPAPPPPPKVLTQQKSERRVAQRPTPPPQPDRPKLSAAELINRSMQIASLSAEIRQRQAAYTGRQRHKHISANTREFKYASYMDAWRAKVERIGRLNYPEEAKRRKLSGTLLLDVALRPDGSVHEVSLRRSSGDKVLDDAAIRIVQLAAPFAPFPDEIRKETDILHIIRTWIFQSGARLYTK